MIIGMVLGLCLLIIAFSWLSKSYINDPVEIYEATLEATLDTKKQCEELIQRSETNINWLKAMLKAFEIDRQNAVHRMELAEKANATNNAVLALDHLQKASNWYSAYYARLQIIYRLKKGPAPPVPVITD